MSLRGLVAICVVVMLAPQAEARRRGAADGLVQVQIPSLDARHVANAHPGVNVVVSFGTAKDGTPADPATFRARFGRTDVTDLFHARPEDPIGTNRYATLPGDSIKLGRRKRNVLRVVAQTAHGKGAHPARDVDRLRFGAAEGQNHAPAVTIAASADVVVPDQPVDFSVTGATDPDGDDVTYAWDFGDGATASGATASHVFAASEATEVVVTLSASDGQAAGTASLSLPTTPGLDAGKTPGLLRLETASALEFGGVAVGTTGRHALTVRNVDAAPTSQVKIRFATSNPAFAVDAPVTIVLGPNESATADVTFTPATAGHHDARVNVVAAAANRNSVVFLAHGYGGVVAGSGPTLLASPVYTIFPTLGGLLPDGRAFAIDGSIGTCASTGAFSTGDVCIVDEDCRTAGERCTGSPVPFDVSELCSDDRSIVLLSDEGTFTDPDPNADPALSSTILRIDLDDAGNATAKKILDRTTENTAHFACDRLPAGQGGQAYLAEFRGVADTAACPRDGREALVRVSKASGTTQTVDGFSRIDAVAEGECEDIDPLDGLAVMPDASGIVAAFESHGLWRLRPKPMPLSPDVLELFQLHPDGTVVFARTRDSGTTGTINVYRLTDQQAEQGAVPVAALTPCGSFAVPNGSTTGSPGRTTAFSLVAGPSAAGSRDATVLVSFVSGIPNPPPDVLPLGNARGVVAFTLPADTTTCTAVGLTSLDAPALAR